MDGKVQIWAFEWTNNECFSVSGRVVILGRALY